jgi:hypothetical protein
VGEALLFLKIYQKNWQKNSQFYLILKLQDLSKKKINNGHVLLVPILPKQKIKTQKFVSMSEKGLRTLPSGYPPRKKGQDLQRPF